MCDFIYLFFESTSCSSLLFFFLLYFRFFSFSFFQTTKGETVFPNGIAINDGMTDEIDGVYIRDVEKEERELEADWQKRRIAKSAKSEPEDNKILFDGLKQADVNDRTDGLFAEKTWQVHYKCIYISPSFLFLVLNKK